MNVNIPLLLLTSCTALYGCLGRKDTQAQLTAHCFSCDQAPPGTIFCDDFEADLALSEKYFEYADGGGKFVLDDTVGRNGSRGMKAVFKKGDVDVGALRKSIGRTPSEYIGKNAVNPEQDFDEIYWRIDIKLQEGWRGGGGDKLTRATVIANDDWAQGAIGHIWSTEKWYLMVDPASGITEEGVLKATRYNDFDNLRWNLGKAVGTTPIFSDKYAGEWFCIEGHMKLNTPGQHDGVFEFWINDELQAKAVGMNWHGDWNSNPDHFKINAVFFENYWNSGSVQDQERYFDNIVISTKRIGCNCAR
ncbi:hypothetical protein [Parapedobacter pyrenivorans]|uniref:hypothetical protein n=1 Tax=Parapedobacter pyrenivorans TaxID=1305674 RepID=UPI001667536D|nr:hypothetical protein [Parapedobacter pyrenivorans]